MQKTYFCCKKKCCVEKSIFIFFKKISFNFVVICRKKRIFTAEMRALFYKYAFNCLKINKLNN